MTRFERCWWITPVACSPADPRTTTFSIALRYIAGRNSLGGMTGIRITPPILHVLLALADEPRHGYGIMQEVAAFTDGEVRLGPGTLYGAIKRMLEAALVEECEGPAEIDDDERRRYYRLTASGREALAIELAQTARTLAVGRRKRADFPKTRKAQA